MSDRRTTDITFRVTPDEKARWQSAAAAEGVGLSAWLRGLANGAYVRRTRGWILKAPPRIVPDMSKGTAVNLEPPQEEAIDYAAYSDSSEQAQREVADPPQEEFLGPNAVRTIASMAPGPPIVLSHCPHGRPVWAWCSECRD